MQPTFGFSTKEEAPYESGSIFAEEGLTPTELKSVKLWRLLVVALAALPHLLTLFYVIRNFADAFTSRNAAYSSILFSSIGYNLIFMAVPVTGIILFLKNKRWGWLAASAAYTVIFQITGLVFTLALFSFRDYSLLGAISLALAGSTIYLLWRQPMRRYYAISKRLALQIIIIAAALSFIVKLFSIVTYLFYRYQ